MSRLWGGRFDDKTDDFFEEFNESFSFDRRLVFADIQGSEAYAQILNDAQILSDQEYQKIIGGLSALKEEIENSPDYWRDLQDQSHEDVHSFVESKLMEKIGDAAKKLHTGRSRNDQVATDIRIFLRESIDTIQSHLNELRTCMLNQAKSDTSAILPGFTHLQKAQPILWSHYLLSFFEMLTRDYERLAENRLRVNRLPLGSGALAGNNYNLDRQKLANILDFSELCHNSIDATSDRDFIVEFIGISAIIMVHLSRLAEDLIIYNSDEFGYVVMSDLVATGSSLMPQKKNPDALELIRGKAGRIFGHHTAILTTLKGLPSCYNKDLQEDKEPLFDTIDTIIGSLKVMTLVMSSLTINKKSMKLSAQKGYLNATDLADYLVNKGVPFREAHQLVGEMVKHALGKGVALEELPLADLQKFCPKVDSSIFSALSLENIVAAKSTYGGTAPNLVQAAIDQAQNRLKK